MKRTQIEAVRKAVKRQREKYPVKKGDCVAVIVTHRPAGIIGGTGARVNVEPYDVYHLGEVTKADRYGRAVKVQIVGEPGAPRDAYDKFTKTVTMATRQAEAKALAATFEVPGNNHFASAEHLRVAIIAHAAPDVRTAYAEHVAAKGAVT